MLTPKKSIPATEIKNRFGDYLGEVIRRQEPVLVERHGKPVAVLVDFEHWKKMKEEKEESSWIRELSRTLDKIEKKHPHAKKFSSVDLLRQIRDEEA